MAFLWSTKQFRNSSFPRFVQFLYKSFIICFAWGQNVACLLDVYTLQMGRLSGGILVYQTPKNLFSVLSLIPSPDLCLLVLYTGIFGVQRQMHCLPFQSPQLIVGW